METFRSMPKVFERLRQPQLALLVAFAVIFGLHLHRENNSLSQLVPETLYQLDLVMNFEPDDEVEVSTYLPMENKRQKVLQETISARLMDFDERSDVAGRYITWWGESNSEQIRYRGLLSLRPVAFDIDEDVEIPQRYEESLDRYLYEHIHAGQGHEHLICNECGRVVEFMSPGIAALQTEICRAHGFEPTHHNLQIFGLCQACSGEAAN